MNLLNLSEENIEMLVSSLSINPNIEGHRKEDLVQWLRLQLKEQRNGGAWKARIREKGGVI
jgi:hypothetical protein